MIKVAGLDVTVDYTDEDFGHLGGYNMEKSQIVIKKDLPVHSKRECLLHEVLECIVHTNQLELKHSDLTTLSMTLYQVMRDNGNITQWK